RFFTSLGVTAMYVVVSVPLQLLLALGLALLLNQGVRGLSYYRALYYLPSLIGGSVAIGILWRTVFGYQGSVNQVLRLLGFEDLPNWVNNPTWSIWTLIALNVWTFGSPMIIFLAGLRQIPAELYEQAQIDGAGAVARFLKITLPMLTPLIFFNVILQTINAFQAFTPAHVISNGTGGPADSAMFYTLYLYIEGFTRYNMGYASALGCILLALIGSLTLLNFLFSRYWVFYNDCGHRTPHVSRPAASDQTSGPAARRRVHGVSDPVAAQERRDAGIRDPRLVLSDSHSVHVR